MNEWTTYRASCTECTHHDAAQGVCSKGMAHKETGVCLSFDLTAEAEADRYISAKQYGQKIGIPYDARGDILRGKSKFVRFLVRQKMKVAE